MTFKQQLMNEKYNQQPITERDINLMKTFLHDKFVLFNYKQVVFSFKTFEKETRIVDKYDYHCVLFNTNKIDGVMKWLTENEFSFECKKDCGSHKIYVKFN